MAQMTGGAAGGMSVESRVWPVWLTGSPMWLWWVLATALGWALGGTVGNALGGALPTDMSWAGYGTVVLGATGAGVLQWLVLRYSWPATSADRGSATEEGSNGALGLRRQVARAGWWAVASTAAWPVDMILVAFVGTAVALGARLLGGADGPLAGIDSADVGSVTGTILYGAVLGVLQWLVLRRWVARAGWWVLASGVGWVAAGLLSGIDAEGGIVGRTLIGVVYGAITGVVLLWLLRQPPPSREP